jgi:RNA polymerase sigma-70 factor, ECF subfamily
MRAPGSTRSPDDTTGLPAPNSRQGIVKAIARVSAGDEAPFRQVYQATSAKLYGVVMRIVGRRDVADDVLQEVYVCVWQRAGEFDPASASPITWLATIARNRALDSVKRKSMRSIDECPEVLQLPSGDDPLADYVQDEGRRRLLTCLDLLGPEKRYVLLQAYFYGMTREEIAQHIGRPVSAVKTWLRRSLAELKNYLEE